MSEPTKPGFDVFLSHNRKDKPSVRRLKVRLGERNLTVWFDEDELQPGVPWQRLLEAGVRASRSVAVLVGKDGLGPWEIEEMEAALQLAVKNKLKVIPVLLPGAPGEVELPLFLANRTWVDLRPQVTSKKLDLLIWGITGQKPEAPSVEAASPKKAATRVPNQTVDVKWSDELRIYGEGFVGRRDELTALDRAWSEGVRIFTLHAEGGAGKTRVVVEWLRRMRDDGWRGARWVFAHSFYSQGNDEWRNASSELFFEQALAHFGYRGEPITQADERGRTLARLLVEQQGLLVLDGLEPLQHPPHIERGRLKDLGITRLVLSLANVPRDETRGFCLITSRQPVEELKAREGATVVQQSLEHLHRNDGAALLREFNVVGPEEELKEASDEFHGHAYSLMLLGSFLKNATGHHDIRRRREVVLLEEDTEHSSHARKMFAAYVRHLGEDSPEVVVLRLLGFFDRAAERELLDVLRAREAVVYEWPQQGWESRREKPKGQPRESKRIEDSLAEVTAPLLDLPQSHWNRVLNRLRDLRLIDLTGLGSSPAVEAHPLLRECFAEQVRTRFPVAWQAGNRRLFEHLSGTAPYWPEGIEGLQPLYQAVAHGCLAGLYEQAKEVYRARILRGVEYGGFYNTRKLGAIGADLGVVACFFAPPWITLSGNLPLLEQAWLFAMAAYNLRTLGRLNEAVEPLRVAMGMYIRAEHWLGAAVQANNLSELELMRGSISEAIGAGEQAMEYSGASGGQVWKILVVTGTTLADALHHAGRRDESLSMFREAESRQMGEQPELPLLYSAQGFQYCDLLLCDAERATWKNLRHLKVADHLTEILRESTAVTTACNAVSKRAVATLAWAGPHLGLLDIALDNLTLARATFYSAALAGDVPNLALDRTNTAIERLRKAGDMIYLPRGLLLRSWLLCLMGDDSASREDLGEAWDIAERGPMPLYQADIHLHRARLFRDRAALAEARRLIEKHGYHRRDGELADAEEAAKGW